MSGPKGASAAVWGSAIPVGAHVPGGPRNVFFSRCIQAPAPARVPLLAAARRCALALSTLLSVSELRQEPAASVGS